MDQSKIFSDMSVIIVVVCVRVCVNNDKIFFSNEPFVKYQDNKLIFYCVLVLFN